MLRSLFVALLLVSASLSRAQDGDPVTQFATNDITMEAAQDAARLSLPMFLLHATDDEGYGIESAAVKVAFDVGSNQSEVIWVSPILWDGDRSMIGLLANQPNFMDDLKAGDQVEFGVSMVRDWSVRGPNGEVFGNYTTRVMLPQMDAETAARLSAALSARPVPAEWQ